MLLQIYIDFLISGNYYNFFFFPRIFTLGSYVRSRLETQLLVWRDAILSSAPLMSSDSHLSGVVMVS